VRGGAEWVALGVGEGLGRRDREDHGRAAAGVTCGLPSRSNRVIPRCITYSADVGARRGRLTGSASRAGLGRHATPENCFGSRYGLRGIRPDLSSERHAVLATALPGRSTAR
jgi:hypothetical protein